MKINWHDVATIVATMAVLGGIVIALLKGFFVTTKTCADTQDRCQLNICKKIDELKEDLKEDRKTIITMKEDIATIKGALTK